MTLEISLFVVGILIFIVAIASSITSVWLIIKYFRFNRKENSLGLTGMQIARKILDDNGLEHIKVKRTGSLLFGNSYSHYFKKVRLRGLIRHETSLTSMGMGAQKEIYNLNEQLDQVNASDTIQKISIEQVRIYTEGIEDFLALENVTNGDLRKIINRIIVNREGEIKIYLRDFSDFMIA